MTDSQQRWLAIGAVVILFIVVFPPYQVEFMSTFSSVLGSGPEQRIEFHPIWLPPELGFQSAEGSATESGRVLSASIYTGILLIELIVACVFIGLAYMMAGKGKAS